MFIKFNMGLCPKPRKDLPTFDPANGLSLNFSKTTIKRGRAAYPNPLFKSAEMKTKNNPIRIKWFSEIVEEGIDQDDKAFI